MIKSDNEKDFPELKNFFERYGRWINETWSYKEKLKWFKEYTKVLLQLFQEEGTMWQRF